MSDEFVSSEGITPEGSALPGTQQDVASTVENDTPEEAARRERDKQDAQRNAAFAAMRRRESAALAEAERERAERMRIEGERQTLMQRVLGPNPSSAGNGAPDPNQFAGGEFNPEYQRAAARFEANQVFREQMAVFTKQQQEAQVRQAAQAQKAGWEESVKSAMRLHNDFEVVVNAASLDLPKTAQAVLVRLKDGGELLYHLAKNPKLAESLSGSELDIAAAIGELRAEVKAAAKSAKEKASIDTDAARPIRATNGSGRTSGEPDRKNTDAWMAWRRKQPD